MPVVNWLFSICYQEQMTLVGHAHLISDLCFTKQGHLMSASQDNSVSLWDISTGHR